MEKERIITYLKDKLELINAMTYWCCGFLKQEFVIPFERFNDERNCYGYLRKKIIERIEYLEKELI